MKILLADPHHEVRAALRLVLEQQPEKLIIEEARDSIELFTQVANGCPDIVLVDQELPGIQINRQFLKSSFVEFIEALHLLCPSVYVIATSSRPNTEKETGRMNADAFICKSDPPDALLLLLKHVPGSLNKED
jgi:DNA-binding NarL/FixJ family response regulator